jgi:fructose-1,6-bisphosphatase/inositol monophosphatase family enzyme
MNYDRELDEAITIVRKTGDRIMPFFNQATPAEIKEDKSPVTIADCEGERLITAFLQENFPDDGILGEEGVHIPSKSGRRWLIDPVDGTKDFIRGNPFWSIQLALQIGPRVVLGVIYCPCLSELLFASDGNGCFWNDCRVAASKVSSLEQSILTISGFNAVWDSWGENAVRSLTRRCWTVRCYGGSYNVILFARGKADIWLSGRGMEWDYAPVQVIARECGARFLTKSGTDLIDEKNCVVCTPEVEPEIRNILRIPNIT